MAEIEVHNAIGEKVSQIELSDKIFNVSINKNILHEVVKMQLAKKRLGTASIKNRSEIRGSTKKLFRQKGTGRARSGSIKSPLRKGGGVIFGPKPKSYKYKVPKKVRRLALKMALSSKLKENELFVIDKFDITAKKTKSFIKVINAVNIKNALIICDKSDDNLEYSSRNVPNFKVLRSEGLNVYDILKYHQLILLEASVKQIEERLLR
jgi:large subunit ribosomal protein L4